MQESAQTRTRGPYRTGIRRREQLVGIAMDVFGEYGFAGGSIRTIAEQAGVNHATLIQHFGSKEGLLTAVLEEWDRRTVENGLTDVSGLDYFRRLPDVMAAHQNYRGLLELFTTIAAEASNPAHPGHAFITQRYATNLATLAAHLREAVEAGDIAPLSPAQIEVEVRLLTAMMDGIGLQWLLNPGTDIRSSVSTYVERAIAAWGGN
ncbi:MULTISPECIES: TetR/AcrR family transcriptional regulator [Arthrobacter]|jgi:AcrR family transcriptional regulator|uniref:TetR/AcrR family transcriptional regulator n=1 Tax=Arthrobacter sp. UNC362MFTsu5.1 TaxID=1449044 RepID=UPI0004880233|nr:TetR/AcrR family transcriptional regulator [Arthrobacter sp. UNC362MFTsu5.1]